MGRVIFVDIYIYIYTVGDKIMERVIFFANRRLQKQILKQVVLSFQVMFFWYIFQANYFIYLSVTT